MLWGGMGDAVYKKRVEGELIGGSALRCHEGGLFFTCWPIGGSRFGISVFGAWVWRFAFYVVCRKCCFWLEGITS